MSLGYEALRHGAAWLDLSARGRIVVRGRDRARLLHAITSNEVKKMTPGTGCYAFLLNPQGRIQADLCLFCFDDHFLLDTEPEVREKVHLHIKRYIIADQVELEDVTAGTAAIGAGRSGRGGDSGGVGRAGSGRRDYAHAAWGDATVAAVTVTGQPGVRIFCPAESAARDGASTGGGGRGGGECGGCAPGARSRTASRGMGKIFARRRCRRRRSRCTRSASTRAAIWGRRSWSGSARRVG